MIDSLPVHRQADAKVLAPVAFLLITLPWLNPVAQGPTPSVWPLLVAWVCSAALLACVSRIARSGPQHWAMIIAVSWIAAGTVSSVLGLLQYFGVADGLAGWVSHARPGEAYANLRQRNQFASLTNIALAAMLWVSSTDRLARQLWLCVLGAILLGVGNAASSSRTGLMQLVLLCVLWALWGGWRQGTAFRLLCVAVLAYAVAMWLLPWLAGFDLSSYGMLARLRTGDLGCSSRTVLWSNVLHLIAQKPWLGWGWGELDYAHFITLYPGQRFCEILDNAHDLPLHLAVELGIPAAVALCGAVAWVIWHQQPWREQNPARQMAWGVLAVIGLHSLLEYPLWYGPFQMAAGLSVWLLWTTRAGRRPLAGGPESHKGARTLSGAQLLRGLVLALAASGLLVTAFSYYRVSQLYLSPAKRSAAYRDDTLAKVRDTWLFRDQARFAELSMTALDRDNAAAVYAMALDLLHFSPEPRVVEKLVESAVMLGRDDDALFYLERFRAAYPAEHARWAETHATTAVRLDTER